jgi:hypothetical protein
MSRLSEVAPEEVAAVLYGGIDALEVGGVGRPDECAVATRIQVTSLIERSID